MAETRGDIRITRRALLVGGGASAAALVACSGRGSSSGTASRNDTRGTSTTTAPRRSRSALETEAEATPTTQPQAEPNRILADGEHFPEGFVVPAGETWALAEGAHVTSARNVVVEGTLRMHQPDPSRTMRLTFVDVDESKFVGEETHEVLETDVGMWMVDEGRLDAQGAPKTAWTRLAAEAAEGAREIVVDDASGWRVGDEVAITATANRSAEDHYQQSDRAVVTSVSGNRIGLEQALSHEHPVVDGRWSAEVINLTRSVVIEGTPDHKAHIIHLHQGMTASPDFRASALEYLEVAHLGPNRENDRGEPSSVVGRYALHWHHGMQSTDGVVVQGVVAHDCGAHAFVAHSSNGIAFRDCASHATLGDAYWWDPGDVSDFVTYDRCIASDVFVDGDSRYKTNGFFAARSTEPLSCAMRDCVATGVQGPDSAGFFWDNASVGVWVFEDCLAHNIASNGLRVWQNTSIMHPIDRFTAYNCHTGVSHGAYANPYQYHGVTAHDCDTGLRVTAVSAADGSRSLEFHDVVVTACDTHLVLEDAPVDAQQSTDFRRCQFDHVIVSASHADSSKQWDFADCGLTPDDFDIEQLAGDAVVRTESGGQAWQLTSSGDWRATESF
jgi:hypothetical protein